MSGLTVITTTENSEGTYWTFYDIENVGEAKELARLDCAEAWEVDLEDVYVVGVLAGRIDVVEWND